MEVDTVLARSYRLCPLDTKNHFLFQFLLPMSILAIIIYEYRTRA